MKPPLSTASLNPADLRAAQSSRAPGVMVIAPEALRWENTEVGQPASSAQRARREAVKSRLPFMAEEVMAWVVQGS
jgi:hypothetical protein